MRLSAYAKQISVTYKTVFRWWKAGKLDAYQLEMRTFVMRDPVTPSPATTVVLYARVPASDQKDDLEWQMQRLKEYAASHGYRVEKVVSEIASDLNDQRPKLLKLLTDSSVGVIIMEYRDYLTRFGFHSIEYLLQVQGRRIEVIFPSDTDTDLVDDFVSVITSMAARMYGWRNSKRRAEQIKQCIEQQMHIEDEV